MADISHVFGSDISLDATGDIATAGTTEETTQRLIRRLLTATGAYVWNAEYGCGLPAQVGSTSFASTIQGIVQAQIVLEDGIDQTQPVTVSTNTDNVGDLFLTVTYTYAETGQVATALVPLT